jgi:hypothetical protein
MYSRSTKDIYKIGHHCVKCDSVYGGYDTSKQGYFYTLDIQTQTGTILGYGVTNKISKRLSTHKLNLSRIRASITDTRIFEGSGTKVLFVENSIKALHKSGLIDCEGFRRESISIDRKEEVLELCKTLKEITLDTQ